MLIVIVLICVLGVVKVIPLILMEHVPEMSAIGLTIVYCVQLSRICAISVRKATQINKFLANNVSKSIPITVVRLKDALFVLVPPPVKSVQRHLN